MASLVPKATVASSSTAYERPNAVFSNEVNKAENGVQRIHNDIVEPIKRIAAEVRLGHLHEAGRIYDEFAKDVASWVNITGGIAAHETGENILSYLMIEIFIPIHKYLRRDFNLLCYFKSLRILAIIKDTTALKTVKAFHNVFHICYSLQQEGFILQTTLENHGLDYFKKRNKPQVNMRSENPIFYVNFIDGFDLTTQHDENGKEITFHLAETSGSGRFYSLKRSAETSLMIFYQNHENKLYMVEVVEKEGKKQEIFRYRLTNPTTANQNPAALQLEEIVDAEFTRTMRKILDSDNEEYHEFDEKRTKEIMDSLQIRTHLYKNPFGSLLMTPWNPKQIETTSDFFAESDISFNPRKNYTNVSWIPFGGKISFFDFTALKKAGVRSQLITEGDLHYDFADDHNQITLYRAGERNLTSSNTLTFVRANWYEAAIACITANTDPHTDRVDMDYFGLPSYSFNRTVVFNLYSYQNGSRMCLETVRVEKKSSLHGDVFKEKRMLFIAEDNVWHAPIGYYRGDKSATACTTFTNEASLISAEAASSSRTAIKETANGMKWSLQPINMSQLSLEQMREMGFELTKDEDSDFKLKIRLPSPHLALSVSTFFLERNFAKELIKLIVEYATPAFGNVTSVK